MSRLRMLAAVFLTLLSLRSYGSTSLGEFTGVVTHEALQSEQLAKLVFIPAREEDGNLRLRAILTLQFGGFESGEYVSYHYENVLYNLLSGELTFDQSNQEVSLSSAVIQNGILTADVLASSGFVGRIKLSAGSDAKPSKPLIEPLGGEYRGRCGKVESALQLYTFRTTEDTTRLGNPFSAYQARGQIAKSNRDYCGSEGSKLCTHSKIKSASYDFFKAKLVLDGYPFGYNCSVKGKILDCGECEFKRVSDEMARPQLSQRRAKKDPISEIREQLKLDRNSSIKGDYTGYVYHEHLGLFQKLRLRISTYNRPNESGSALVVSSEASLEFDRESGEIITYRFEPVDFPNPVLKSRIILSNSEADVDAIVAIENISEGIAYGSWNSHIFGRVGSFVVTKNGDLPSIPTVRLLGAVTSGYEEVGGEKFITDIKVGKGNAPIGSDNPFDPLKFTGYVWRKKGSIVKESITDGSFDFYTGKIAVLFGEEKALNGFMVAGREPSFRRLGGGFGTLMQTFELSKYRKTQFDN